MSLLLAVTPTPPPTTAVYLTPSMFWGPLAIALAAILLPWG